MVAAGDDLHSRRKNLLRNPRRDAAAPGGVFAVGDHKVHPMLPAQAGEQQLDRPPPRFADDVANEKDFHRPKLMERPGRARKSGL